MGEEYNMKKRIISFWLTFSILLSMIPLSVLTAFAQDKILYGDADGNGKIELLDVNLMERYKEGDDEAEAEIHFTETDVNADGVEYSVEQPEEALGAEDVSAEFDEVFSAQNETELKTGMEQLIDRYKEMLD